MINESDALQLPVPTWLRSLWGAVLLCGGCGPTDDAEVYMALQQGIADGQETPISVLYSMGFHEVQRYLAMTGHIQSSIQILINERVGQRLAAGGFRMNRPEQPSWKSKAAVILGYVIRCEQWAVASLFGWVIAREQGLPRVAEVMLRLPTTPTSS